MAEYRENPEANEVLKSVIVENLDKAGLQEDCPFKPATLDTGKEMLTPEAAGKLDTDTFVEYIGRLYTYLQVRAKNTLSLRPKRHAYIPD